MDRDDNFGGAGDEAPEYERLLWLDDLESLLEELEEGGWDTDLHNTPLPGEMRGRINAARIGSLDELKRKIARLHASLDGEDVS